jgi:hypothetical protein
MARQAHRPGGGNDEELGITQQVDEEDMPDLPEILIGILSHDLPSRYL